jgi:hypothetical protein
MARPAPRRTWSRLKAHDGFALILALAILIVFGIATAAVIQFTVANQHSASHSNARVTAVGLAEAGIDNAVSQIAQASQTSCSASYCAITDPTWNPLHNGTTISYENGSSVTYFGTLRNDGVGSLNRYAWVLTSTGRLRNPIQGNYITKTVRADVLLKAKTTQTLTTDGWKYIYSKRTGTPGGCDQSIYNNTNVQSSMYVSGNLCMNTPSSIVGPANAGDPTVSIIVNGYVNLDTNTNIGTSSRPVTEAHIRLGCEFKGTATPATPNCRKINGQQYDEVYTSDTATYNPNTYQQSDTNIPSVPAPVANFTDWYSVASPGPAYPCLISVGTPPQFDNDQVNNSSTGGSIPSVVTLTPVTTYDCWTPAGELAWLPANTDPPSNFPRGAPGLFSRQNYGQFYIIGTAYIDGSATVDASPIRYRGNGALYVSGTFLVKNSVFCAILTSSLKGCNTQAWEAQTNPDIFVAIANGTGSAGGAQGQVAAGDSVEYKSSSGQGALYGTNAIEIDTTSLFQGPMVAQTEVISQSGGSPYPIFVNVPFGLPGNRIDGYDVMKVQNYND